MELQVMEETTDSAKLDAILENMKLLRHEVAEARKFRGRRSGRSEYMAQENGRSGLSNRAGYQGVARL